MAGAKAATKSKSTTKTSMTKRATAVGKSPVRQKPTTPKSTSKANKLFSQVVAAGKLNAIDRVQAVIEFKLDGTIVTANSNFLATTGYSLKEIQGQHHKIFVAPAYSASAEYREFWDKLRRGVFDQGEYCRISKTGSEIWLNASYNPIFNASGKAIGIVKFATDITESKVRNADYEGQLRAINKSQAVIEFSLDGIVLTANENFCSVLDYKLDEIKGQHHRLFCETSYTTSSEYTTFWENLRGGKYQSGQFKRIGKGGHEIWIQASYNPIFDLNGRPYKVVKYASDITHQKQLEFEVAARQKRESEIAAQQKESVARILECVNAMADGDFEREIPDLGVDAIGQVASALGAATHSIRGTLLDVTDVANTVSSAAQQLSAASQEIAIGAQTQASSLEETASSLEEITSTVKQNSDNAQQARQLANGSRDIAEKGGAIVSEAVKAMAEINQSSKKIADIITTIDEIAFQTNLLALNAAVEAARAGEQGRGFAVVAAEVRHLAQRSASSAKEIKSLIQDSVQRVENGTHLVNKSGETLNEIVGSVKRVTDIVAEIAAASKEQLTGIEQVNKAVSQMDRVTQANASQTEEVSGTASSLLTHAKQLQERVSQFNLGEADEPPVQARAVRDQDRRQRKSKPQARRKQRPQSDSPRTERTERHVEREKAAEILEF